MKRKKKKRRKNDYEHNRSLIIFSCKNVLKSSRDLDSRLCTIPFKPPYFFSTLFTTVTISVSVSPIFISYLLLVSVRRWTLVSLPRRSRPTEGPCTVVTSGESVSNRQRTQSCIQHRLPHSPLYLVQ